MEAFTVCLQHWILALEPIHRGWVPWPGLWMLSRPLWPPRPWGVPSTCVKEKLFNSSVRTTCNMVWLNIYPASAGHRLWMDDMSDTDISLRYIFSFSSIVLVWLNGKSNWSTLAALRVCFPPHDPISGLTQYSKLYSLELGGIFLPPQRRFCFRLRWFVLQSVHLSAGLLEKVSMDFHNTWGAGWALSMEEAITFWYDWPLCINHFYILTHNLWTILFSHQATFAKCSYKERLM